ncbi:class I SAM-dependent methyltransferase [sulfur-oxidizing endosymbiont of Gigantopelta aegis]|uniref:class I SAM-dependent methyltransferase n=1 Tax=sulfur-oxidizing endosymbiont of Gigantopelta aegis TaxID=2794934 RepID=UPI001FE688E2|nr:class I SAM-dependent methyltransferase [sulfur-oxidizing endosymbiont of Gigantopelta aegis]
MHILDAGCGSGRDSRYFIEHGFAISAFDASKELATIASEYIGQSVEVNSFQDFKSRDSYDGIWACASLLHVPADEMILVIKNISQYLKKGGIFYCSFKYGNTDFESHGRSFTNANEKRLKQFIQGSFLSVEKYG